MRFTDPTLCAEITSLTRGALLADTIAAEIDWMNNLPSILVSSSSTTPPLPPSRVGEVTETTNVDGSPFVYEVEDQETFIAPSNTQKAFLLQKLLVKKGGSVPPNSIMLRIGYYMIAHKERVRGKWAWGQYAAMTTPTEMELIVAKMKAKGWLSLQ